MPQLNSSIVLIVMGGIRRHVFVAARGNISKTATFVMGREPYTVIFATVREHMVMRIAIDVVVAVQGFAIVAMAIKKRFIHVKRRLVNAAEEQEDTRKVPLNISSNFRMKES
jgi:hypothetical protein